VMDSVFSGTDGMQGFVYTNGDVIDTVNWDDLEDIQWITMNVTDVGLDELDRRMTIVKTRSNVINQTVIATLDDYNLERVLDIATFGIERGYRLRFHRDLYRGIDPEYRTRLLKRYHEVCDLLEGYLLKGYDVHTTFLFDTLIPLWDREASPYPCGKRIATIFPDGSIGPCIRDHEHKTGTIFDPDPMSRIDCETFHYGEHLPDECGACESRMACQGGCPHDKLLLTGTTDGKSVMCDIHREIIPRLQYLGTLRTKPETMAADMFQG
jgi:radical SAM protein with 4Fe4S-binding SPASM domain